MLTLKWGDLKTKETISGQGQEKAPEYRNEREKTYALAVLAKISFSILFENQNHTNKKSLT